MRMTWPEGSSNWKEPCPSQVIRIISLGVYRRRGRVGKPVCGQDTGGKTAGATIGLQVSRLLVLHFERQFLLRLVTERARHRQSVGGRLVWRHEKLAERSRILNGRKDRRIDAHVFSILECKRQRVYVAALFHDVPVDAECGDAGQGIGVGLYPDSEGGGNSLPTVAFCGQDVGGVAFGRSLHRSEERRVGN